MGQGTHHSDINRAQVLLLPDTVDDYVGSDNPVRFIDAFVDSLDLAGAGFERAEPKKTGRPGYDPAGALKEAGCEPTFRKTASGRISGKSAPSQRVSTGY